MKAFSSNYQAESGQTALFHALKAGYKNTVWDKTTLFIPYEEFGLPKGKHDLRMDLDAIYKNGTLLN